MIHRLTRLLLTAAAGAGPAQAATANLFASGTLAAGHGASSATHLGTGQYEVTFSANVPSCANVATTINASSQALQMFTARAPPLTDTVITRHSLDGHDRWPFGPRICNKQATASAKQHSPKKEGNRNAYQPDH